jgi:transposase
MNDPTVSALPTATVLAGIDWASGDHAVCVIDTAGAVLWRHTVAHSRAGLARLTTRLTELGVTRVGIERPDGPVVEALLAAGLRVAVVPPRQVKNLRSRYRGAGKDDRFDAYLLADTMRTDGHRYTDLTRDTPQTTGLRGLVRARTDLVEIRVGLVNQLRHTLELAFPGAVGLFFDLHSPSPALSCIGSRPRQRPPPSMRSRWPRGWPPRATAAARGRRSSSTGCAPLRPD